MKELRKYITLDDPIGPLCLICIHCSLTISGWHFFCKPETIMEYRLLGKCDQLWDEGKDEGTT